MKAKKTIRRPGFKPVNNRLIVAMTEEKIEEKFNEKGILMPSRTTSCLICVAVSEEAKNVVKEGQRVYPMFSVIIDKEKKTETVIEATIPPLYDSKTNGFFGVMDAHEIFCVEDQEHTELID